MVYKILSASVVDMGEKALRHIVCVNKKALATGFTLSDCINAIKKHYSRVTGISPRRIKCVTLTCSNHVPMPPFYVSYDVKVSLFTDDEFDLFYCPDDCSPF